MSPGKAEVSFGLPELDGEKKYKLIMCEGDMEYEGLELTAPIIEFYAFEPGLNFDKKVIVFFYNIKIETKYEIIENGRYTLIKFEYRHKEVTEDLTVYNTITHSEVVMDNKELKIRVNYTSRFLNGEFEGDEVKSGYKGDCVEHPDLVTIDNPMKHF